MSADIVLRLLDTFFRRFWLYLVPVVLLGGMGVWIATSNVAQYTSVGTMQVEPDARVAQLTGNPTDPGFGWETPAAATSRTISSLVGTDTFVENVIAKGGLEQPIAAGVLTFGEVRQSIGVYPDGSRLVKFVGTNRTAEVAERVAWATMEAFVDVVMENEISDNVVARDFIRDKLADFEADVRAAEDRLEDWLNDNPEPLDERDRPTGEILQLERLQQDVLAQDQRLAEAESSIQQAELSVEQKAAEVRQRFAVIDPPRVPWAPLPTFQKTVLTVLMALVLGSVIALAGVVIATIMDRTLRFPEDVKKRLGVRVIAVVPQVKVSAGSKKRSSRSKEHPSAKDDGTATSEVSDDDARSEPDEENSGDSQEPIVTSTSSTVNGNGQTNGAHVRRRQSEREWVG